MEVMNIQSWNNDQVMKWFKGLDESVQKYETHFRSAGVVGNQLLNLSYEGLYNLRIHMIGHQELILDAVSLLQQLDYGLDLETLQSRALCLKCRCRGLRSSVASRRKEAEEYEYDGGVSLQRGATNQLLHLAADVLDEGKQLILWLDRSPFNGKQSFHSIRDKMVNLCYELSVTMQQSVFACVIEDAALNICTEMENCADGIVQSNDSITIQPVSLEQIHLRELNPLEGLGLFIKATFEGHHVVTGTRPGSIASRARRIASGDEVVAVNGKAVVGWTLASLVAILKEHPNEVSLLLKKRPQLSRSASSSNLLSTLQRSEKDRAKIFRVATPIRRIEDPSKSHSPAPSTRPQSSTRLSSGTWSSRRSHDHVDDASSERTSRTSGSDVSDRWHYGATNDSRTSHSSRKGDDYFASKQPKSRRQVPQISLDESSPMDMLKFPPPPSEPYTPKNDNLTVQQIVKGPSGSRTPSPNSLLDIEQNRRYTVIGGSTVDERWYEDFLSQINSCQCRTSNNRPSREKLSSNEEVFSPNPSQKQPPFTRVSNERNTVLPQRYQRSGRPVSMPPDYYHQVNISASHQRGTSGRGRYRNYQPSNRSSANCRNPQTCNHIELPLSRQNHNYNNNNHNRGKSMVGESPSRKTPPKPPPRSSSIQKLSHRYSNEIQAEIAHPRQSSLPEKINYSVVASDAEKRFSSPMEKPAIPRKPKVSHVKQFIFSKAGRSKSTPHLQQGREEEKQHAAKLTASNERLKDRVPTALPNPVLPVEKQSSDTKSSPRPIPKPRHLVKTSSAGRKSLDSGLRFERSNSHNDILAASTAHSGQRRRQSAGHVPYKNKNADSFARSAEILNAGRSSSHVTPPTARALAPARSSPTRLSYTEAVKNEEKSARIVKVGDLRSNDIPQPNDYYEVRVIAGVPVRLRKSLNRLTGSKLKVSQEKSKPNQPHGIGMKGERRRVSCRDLGRGDCQGWLWKKKSGDDFGNGRLTSKWAKRWVVIKDRAIYCYRNDSQDEDQRAECYISLPGYTYAVALKEFCGSLVRFIVPRQRSGNVEAVASLLRHTVRFGPYSICLPCKETLPKTLNVAAAVFCRSKSTVAPAPECKRKFAFRISHLKRKTFFFAAERQTDMSRWMNKMGLAAIEYKFDSQRINEDDKAKDNDYYSESDEEIETTSCISDRASNSSSFSGANGSATGVEGINGDVRRGKMDRFHTTSQLVGINPPEYPEIRRDSASSKKIENSPSKQIDSTSKIIENGVTSGNFPSVDINKPDSHQNEIDSKSTKLSRSLNSLLVSEKPSKSLSASYQRAKDRATKWSTRIRRKTMTNAERLQIITDQSESSDGSPSSSTTPLSTPKQKRVPPTRHHSMFGFPQSLSAPALTAMSSTSSDQHTPEKQQEPQAESPDQESLEVETSSNQLAVPSPPLSRISLLHNMRQSIKKAEVDLLGANRRVTLRRKMTVLSHDPRVNERMLRKRALERELKAKELELAYFDQLLNKDKITRTDLNSWINQHPSLVAEIGTIRRLSKNKRPPLDENSLGINLQEVSDESNPNSRPTSANLNNNNNRLGPRGRPRSSAIGAADLDFSRAPADSRSNTLPSKPDSRRRRKLLPNRPFQPQTGDKPYLETDL